ncbi:MAG: tripartite tricarboxylate transporter substrate binding protein [Betaproteobacteria bacterium]|nr:MAG: tripartite tricarboxylate transporter substrate binding protein [Betaproteobacteria bacterium]
MINIFKINKLIAIFGLALIAGAAQAQWQPDRNVALIVPSSAGGSLDNVGRTIQRMWDQQKLVPTSSIIVNMAGGGHAIAYNFLDQRAGNPLFMSITSSTLHTSHINGRVKLSYRDFTPLTVMMTEYIAFAVRPDSPLQTGKDLIEALRKDPGKYSLALSSAVGGTHHISFGLPLLSGKVDIKKAKLVAFNSTGEAVTALLGGHVDVLSGGTVQIAPHVANGRMRLLAVSSAQRLPGALASGPTWPELGYEGVFENWRGIIGTKGLTREQVAYWDRVFSTIAASSEFKDIAAKNQWTINYKNAAETARFFAADYKKLKAVMDFLGLSKQ